jgi:hypothetical protein
MKIRIPFAAAILTALVMVAHVLGVSSVNAATAGKALLHPAVKASEAAKSGVVEVKRRYRRGYRRHYRRRYYDRPYFGFYFGPYYYDRYDYDYYPYRYRYRRSYRGRCSDWSRRCARNWGYGNNDYYGCLRYHGCR